MAGQLGQLSVIKTNIGLRKIIVTSIQECYIKCVCLSRTAKGRMWCGSLLKGDAWIANN